MAGRSINVVVPNPYGIYVAKTRLRKMVDHPSTDARFKTGSFAWDEKTNTFTVDVLAYGKTVQGKAHIEASSVTITSEPIPGLYLVVAGAVYLAEREIKAMLTEELK